MLSAAKKFFLIVPKFNPLISFERSVKFDRKFKNWPNDFLPFYWERPKKVPGFLKSGDLIRGIGVWDPKAFKLGYELSDELKNAPEIVRRQFTLEFANRPDIVEFQYYHIMKQMQRHPFDFNSPEARITRLTVKIRNLLEHFKQHHWAAREKTPQNSMILKRGKILTQLYYQDYDRYKFITEQLMIDHKPAPLGRIVHRIERKRELRRLTSDYCNKLIDEKLNAYRDKLKSQQQDFQEEKQRVQQWIEQEEKVLGILAQHDKSHPIDQNQAVQPKKFAWFRTKRKLY